jgi:hypothetical protein
MTINTTSCNFNQTPLYFTSMAGISSHYILAGFGAIYAPATDSFTIYCRSQLGWSSSTMMTDAQSYLWNVNWFGMYY